MTEWISVEERLPAYGVRVLITRLRTHSDTADRMVVIGRRTYTDGGGEHWALDGQDRDELSYKEPFGKVVSWTPLLLPDPPEDTDE